MRQFSYTPHLGLGRQKQYKPIVPLELIGENGVGIGVTAMIDTGAEYNVFSDALVEQLGIELDDELAVTLKGVGGNKKAHGATIGMRFMDQRWTETVYFTDADHENLLGNQGFHNRFNVTLLYAAGVFGVEPVATLDWHNDGDFAGSRGAD